jgi:hypothetical protein
MNLVGVIYGKANEILDNAPKLELVAKKSSLGITATYLHKRSHYLDIL